MRVSGAEALCVAANVFIGQTEAPVLIAPYIAAMTTSELLTMMIGGMAHVSGAVMLAYVLMGAPLKYLITASVMAAPGTFLISKIMWPETESPVTMGTVKMNVEKTSANFIDAAATGASQGMTLVLNIAAMLIAFIALIAMLNGFLGWIGHFWGDPAFSLQTIFGWVLGPLAYILGAPKQDAATIGKALDAEEAEALGLVTFALDDIDWDDEIRVFFEERASFSPDGLTGMEANLRFAGPETMESKIFSRLTAWQNWIFQRPNAVGENGALRRYGTGQKAQFDMTRV